MDVKPRHQGGYTARHADLCERTLVTLMRGLGDWKSGIYLVGGLVPRYLVPQTADDDAVPPHVGTTDVDLVLDLEVLAGLETYRRLEQELLRLGFERGANDDGQAQHFRWRKPVDNGIVIVVDLLSEAPVEQGERVVKIERGVSALGLPGAHLVCADYVEVPLTADLLDEKGIATEIVRVANIVPFIVLKAVAYDRRAEEKDAYDLIYCLENFPGGPGGVGAMFGERRRDRPDEPLFQRALDILRDRFATDDRTPGARKDGPVSYARFRTELGRSEMDARHRQNAAAAVEVFLAGVSAASGRAHQGQ